MASKLVRTERSFRRSLSKMSFPYKANMRIHRGALEGDVNKVNHILTHGEAGMDDRDKNNRFAEEPGAGDTKPTSEESNNKSDTKNIPEGKGSVCGDVQQSKKDDESPKNETLTRESSSVEDGLTYNVGTNKSDTKIDCEGKGEVSKYFWQSKNDAKRDQDKEENQASCDNNDSDKGAECIFWTAPARRIKVKSLHGTPPSSPDSKSVSEPLPLSCVGKFTAAEDQRGEQKINKHKEDDLGTSSHRSRLRIANIAQPDDARNVGTLVSNAAAHVEVESENHQRRLNGPEKKQPHNICESPSLSCDGHLFAPSDQRKKHTVSGHIKGKNDIV
uniref:uncharacterized protein LOC120885495 isoform X2 n=1 Tax=Ictidomys tridecemlineatus TaxID=43179 RepID=UPI001A9F3C0A|nr:uncharacterized protein LOC120885495 isoform X2 [Ictidomys tridecemlineatus]